MRYRELNNKVTPAIPYLFLYDEDGGQEITTGGVFHKWDTVKIKTSHFIYNADDNRVTFKSNTSGFYKITFNCSFTDDEGGETKVVESSIYKNGSELTGSKVFRDYTQSISYVAYLSKDDYIQVYSKAGTSPSRYTKSGSSRLIIEYIPMRGWDNSNGGRIEYKGDVMR
jgi:hypothetical protein